MNTMRRQQPASQMPPLPARAGRERGSVLAVSVFGMLTFLLATGLCVDISHFYLVKTELQNAADAAALAAASALNSDDGGITKAIDLAVASMNNYEFNHKPTAIARADVRFAVNLSEFDGAGTGRSEAEAKTVARDIRFVKVTIPPKAVNVFFASMVIGNAKNLSAAAIAGMSVAPNQINNPIPLTVIDDDVRVITPGNLYTIRAAPQNSVSPGNYQILAIDGAGASDDRIGLASGVRKRLTSGDIVETKPGVSAGAVRQGINTRFGDYSSGLDSTLYPPDKNVKEGITYQQYLDSQHNNTNFEAPNRGMGVWNRRVVMIPIVKKSEFAGGRDDVRIDRFGAFFIRSKVGEGNGGDIEAEYIGLRVNVGSGGYDPNGGETSPEMTFPVLYR